MIPLLLSTSVAWPCGALFTTSEGIVASDAQEVILRVSEGATEIEYNIRYTGDAEEFGWLIPVPEDVSSVEEGDHATFDEYRSLTAPLWSGDLGGDEGCACGDGSKGDFMNGGGDFGVELASGYVGDYAYTVLDGDNFAAVLAWLDDQEFEYGDQSPAIQYYGNGYDFVALTLSPSSSSTGDEGRTLVPLKIRYEQELLTFPALMSYFGTLDYYRTTVWIAGDSRAELVEGWTEVEFGSMDWDDDGSDLSDQFDSALAELGGDEPVYAMTWAGESTNGTFVTRFDTYAPREAHEADPVWEFGSSTDESFAELVVGGASSAGWLAVLPLLGLGLARRRRE